MLLLFGPVEFYIGRVLDEIGKSAHSFIPHLQLLIESLHCDSLCKAWVIQRYNRHVKLLGLGLGGDLRASHQKL